MKKVIFAGIVGGVILWIWGFIAWVVLPLHLSTVTPIPNETEFVESLKRSLPAPGVYELPSMPRESAGQSPSEQESAMADYMAKYEAGPTGMIFYDPAGRDPFMVNQMISGLLIFILSAAIVAWLLSRSTAAAESYLSRVIYCGMIGTLIAVACHLSAWNWMGYPLDWTRALMIDSIVAWLLAGMGIAAIVRQQPVARV